MKETKETKRFERWWSDRGQFIDPDFSDVPWFDKRKGLAIEAFVDAYKIGMAVAGNYIADDTERPTEILFANGTKVKIFDGALEILRNQTELDGNPS